MPIDDFTDDELIRVCRVMDSAGVPTDAPASTIRAVLLVLRDIDTNGLDQLPGAMPV